MKPIAACWMVILGLAGHPGVLARSITFSLDHIDLHSGAAAQLHDATQLRGQRAFHIEPRDDNDSLTHELVDQATTQPAKKEFDAIDRNIDGRIDYSEYLASTRAGPRVAGYRFNCSDANLDSTLDLEEFNTAQSKPQDMERCVSMLLAFRLVDKDQDGELSQLELWSNVGGPSFDARWAFNVACSDLNRDGKVSPMEFSTDIYGCSQDKSDAAMRNFSDFKISDADGNGCVDETEMAVATNTLFGMNLISDKPPGRATRELATKSITCFDFDANRCLDEKEYDEGLLDPTTREAQCLGVHYEKFEADMDFAIMDTNNDGKVSKQEYYTYCDKLDINIHQQEAEALFISADVNKNGFIDEEEFFEAGENHDGDGPGVFFFLRSTDPARSLKSRTAWLGSFQKTLAETLKPSM